MLKNAYFLKKYRKYRLSFGGSAPEPPFTFGGWGLRSVVTLTYYNNFVEFVSNVKCVSLPSNTQNKITPVHVLRLLLPHL